MNELRADALTAFEKPLAYVALVKPDVTFLVVITTVAGFYLGTSGPLNWPLLLHTVCGTALVAGGTAALNQYFERDKDALMRRTASRPLPTGQLQPAEALIFGIGAILLGGVWLALAVGALACLLALATCVLYLGVYTPLKTRTTLATTIGAFPGAIPPLIGWVGAHGSLSLGGWVLFAILFFWQFPHFMAIAWMYRDDYARAGIRMLPTVDPKGDATFGQIVSMAGALIPISILPASIGMVGLRYFAGALILGVLLFAVSLWANRLRSTTRAKWLMHATVAHIPLLLGWMIFDKIVR
jgi:protoheme IX farnesyltransferase